MIRKSLESSPPMFLLPKDQRKCTCIGFFVIAQCVGTFVIAGSILYCVWVPDLIPFDAYKLASIMYLFDKKACGYNLQAEKVVKNLKISNDTKGLDVLPYKWKPASVTVSTRLSTKTRKYLEMSIVIHFFWMAIAVMFIIITKHNKQLQLLKNALKIMFYMMIVVLIFDLSMAIVYVSHIKQSLTKGMIVRYSGWSVELNLKNYDDFAGWLPMIASACWMRGIIILGMNVYCVRVLKLMRGKSKRREIMKRLTKRRNKPFPSATHDQTIVAKTLYFGPGELKPVVKKPFTYSYY